MAGARQATTAHRVAESIDMDRSVRAMGMNGVGMESAGEAVIIDVEANSDGPLCSTGAETIPRAV